MWVLLAELGRDASVLELVNSTRAADSSRWKPLYSLGLHLSGFDLGGGGGGNKNLAITHMKTFLV